MPKRDDLKKILIVGSGPIVIGQACEFDYSGSQAAQALKTEGYKVILVNSNPATIMTDPELADVTYIEPITARVVAKIIQREKPDALLSTMGGQTGLNVTMELHQAGVLRRYGVEVIGADIEAIEKAENRERFAEAMNRIGLELPKGGYAQSLEEARKIVDEIGYPAIIRPSFTLGGSGGRVAYNLEEFLEGIAFGLAQSPVNQILVEESIIGWKEFELEVMRDKADNAIIICSIENFDPMGVHTGDSITVAPIQTLSDREYQRMRDASLAVIREIGVETGGSNIQFAVHPETGRMVVIEMNPRVSRSSALASKATGFPIAKIAAKLAVDLRLDEIPNDITRETPASFEPTIDYVAVKIPRWAFEKFPGADVTLGTQMKSVGEVMSLGRTFKEALLKGVDALELDAGQPRIWDGPPIEDKDELSRLKEEIRVPNWRRIFQLFQALRSGTSIEELFHLSSIDPWFLNNLADIVRLERQVTASGKLSRLPEELLRQVKSTGFSDSHLAHLLGESEGKIRTARERIDLKPVYRCVDTCAAEFEAYTPYLYSTYGEENESTPSDRPRIIILGSGPNRIGQGIEFDYSCVHASLALREDGYDTIMVNSNPETVSTDYDISSKLYFEPLNLERVLAIIEMEKPMGVIISLGGQTPLKLGRELEAAGVRILGTSPESIDLAENRERFGKILDKLGINAPSWGVATSLVEAKKQAGAIGYPVLLRPSYVLGGRAMVMVYDEASLEAHISRAMDVAPNHPIFIDHFLEDAYEVDVDAISDGKTTVLGAIMQHIENAGIHSGDSACVIPPYLIDAETQAKITEQTKMLAAELNVVGLMNIQFAIKDGVIYVLEVNPRASRTVPFVSKTIGVPLAGLAARVMAGKSLAELGFTTEAQINYVSVKEAVLPFIKFPGEDIILGPEMKSTGEVMGIHRHFGLGFAKAQEAAGVGLPTSGSAFISVHDKDKPSVLPAARELHEMGFNILATAGTAEYLWEQGILTTRIFKVNEGRPDVVDYIKSHRINLVINTPLGKKSQYDDYSIRRHSLLYGVPCITTISGAVAAVEGIKAIKTGRYPVRSLQEYYKGNEGRKT
ncbi:carbamoyl-phosphate synthase large subunit [candidate division KSB1 bacterium]